MAVGWTILLAITVFAFLMFDRDSHSASDTLRPFLIPWFRFGCSRSVSVGTSSATGVADGRTERTPHPFLRM